MNLSRFHRSSDLAGVISVAIVLAGLIAMFQLPISNIPKSCRHRSSSALYPGANPNVLAETVATPLEEQINGTENMLYMFSQASTDGTLTLTVTFKLGTDPDLAQQMVQNRVNQALLACLKRRASSASPPSRARPTSPWSCICSPNQRHDMLYLRNYAVLNVKDQLARPSASPRAIVRFAITPCASGSTRKKSPSAA
jgi:multidrug efflux pump